MINIWRGWKMKDKNKNIINEAEKILNLEVVKQAVKEIKDYVPYIAEMTMDMYKGFVKVGFTPEQAFIFAKDYTLRVLLPRD